MTGAVLLALAAGLPLSIALTNLTLAVLAALALARLLKEPGAWKRQWNPALWALLAYALAGLLTAALGVDPMRSLHEAAKDWHKPWTLGVALLSLAAVSRARVERAMAAGFCAAAVIGLWQSATQRAGDAFLRAHAFVHPVTYGDMMAAAVLGGLCFWGRGEAGLSSAAGKRWTAGFLALTGAALVFNQTRGALLGLGAGFFAVCLVDKRLRRWALPLAGAAAAAVLIWELLPHELNSDRSLFTLLKFKLHRPDGRLNPAMARFELWSAAWRMFKDHRLLGVGPGNYNTEFTRYFQGSIDSQSVWGSAHNLYLQQLAERGVAGFSALAAALAVLTGRAYGRARRNPNAWNLWAWGAWAGFLVMNVTEAAFQTELAATFYLFAWACAETRNDIPAEAHA